MAVPDLSERFEQKSRTKPYLIFLIVIMGFGSASYGYASSIIATTLSQPSWTLDMGLATKSNANALIGATNGMFYAGGFFGSLGAGWVSAEYGRKMAAIVACAMIIVFSALITASQNIGMFIAFRFLTGVGAGAIMAIIPVWVAEVSPPKVRGALVVVHAVMVNVGYVVASYVGVGFYHYKGGDIENVWRGPMGLSLFFPTLFLCGAYWLPESPRYLVSKNRMDEAWAVIHRLHSDAKDPTDEFARREFVQIKAQMELDKTFTPHTILRSFVDSFTKPSLRTRSILTILIVFAQMSSGAVVINNYGGLIYSNLGYETATVLQFQGGYQVAGLVMNWVPMLYVDRFKRSTLLSIGFAGSAIAVIIECALQAKYLNTTDREGLAGCVTALYLSITFYGLFIEGPGFAYVTEIWPTQLRGQGFAMSIAVYNLTCILWLQAAPTAFANIGWKYYIIFIVIGAIAAAAMLLFLPDTLHKPLEEIAACFGDVDAVAVRQTDLDHESTLEPKGGGLHVEGAISSSNESVTAEKLA